MKNNNDISDELLAKFLCGKTTPEETEVVMAYMEDGDERVEDLRNISAAIEVQKDAEKAAASAHRRRTVRTTLWTVSSAAAVALILVVGIATLRNSVHDDGSGNVIAQVTDTIIEDESAQQPFIEGSDTNVPKTENRKDIAKPSTMGMQQYQSKNYAESEKKAGYCHMLFPKQNVYVVPQNKKYFDFSWDTDAASTTLTLYDNEHRMLTQKEINDGYVKFYVEDYNSNGQVYWELTAAYGDGTVKKSSGIVKFE